MNSDYGTYRLTYTPPASTGEEDYPNIAIDMSTDGDASVPQMLRFFEAFLSAAGYVLKGELEVVETKADNNLGKDTPFAYRDIFDFGDDDFSFTGNPYAPIFSPDTISFSSYTTAGGFSSNVVTLG
jgi:hypothetical protein